MGVAVGRGGAAEAETESSGAPSDPIRISAEAQELDRRVRGAEGRAAFRVPLEDGVEVCEDGVIRNGEQRWGRWSDGRPVVAGDVVETIAALRSSEVAEEFTAILAAEAVAENRVRLRFERPYGRWPHLFSGGRSILPAHVIQEGGVEAYRDAVPVSGGAFTLDEVTPGRELVFTANPDSPLGAPALAELRVLFTPSYETALGLLADREVDVAVGYLALNPVARADELVGIEAAAPLGGTWVGLWWRADGGLGGHDTTSRERRARFRDAVGLRDLVEGLLGDTGEEAHGVLPGSDGPWTGEGSPVALGGDPQPSLLVPRHQEAVSFTARTLQREFRSRGGGAELVRLEPLEVARRWEDSGDGALLVRRDPPRPALAGRGAGEAAEQLLRGDRAARVTDPDVAVAQDALHADAAVLPLYRIGVAHAWHTDIDGVRPSSWPGLAFWSAPSWAVSATAARDVG
ncbi:MAG: hypothetical protein KY469_21330 [Actinobacteria bacterium]|nr:hypothetical protein [Actinomycetota bacterium]